MSLFIFDQVEFIRPSTWELFSLHYFIFAHLISHITKVMFISENLKAIEEHKEYINYM